MSDLTRDDVDELRRLHDERKAISDRIAPDVTRVKQIDKQINALLGIAAKAMAKSKRNTRNRYGVTLRFVESAGRVAWRKIVEKLKSKEYADQEAAKVAPNRKLIYEFPPSPAEVSSPAAE